MDYLDIDRSLFVPLYVIGRMAGWAAHFVEQQTQSPRTFRTHYTGVPLRHVRKERDSSP